MRLSIFTGGIFDTNCFLVQTTDGLLLFDAPQGSAAWLTQAGHRPTALILTHGHIDHTIDAARIHREHGCPVFYHADGLGMMTEPDFFQKMGFAWEIEPIAADRFIAEGPAQDFGGELWDVFEVPGHCPGSLCFLSADDRMLIGGDVLFAGGVGRWDLPGGNRDLLLHGIKRKLLPLGDEIVVHPGHGPATTIGHERLGNPYLA